jgi:NAD(P)-dependent dehydrogenase (short-subunit alcohol dehydrogenase family)
LPRASRYNHAVSPNVVIFGGYGVFGGRVARELAARGVPVRIVGRSRERAIAEAAKLGAGHDGAAADLNDRDECLAAIGDASVVVNCAGPFTSFSPALVELCLEATKSYVDIAEGRAHARGIAGLNERFAARQLTAAYGCSSLPTVSIALAIAGASGFNGLAPQLSDPIAGARCTLFIGHDNPKGSSAVASAAAQVGRPIETTGGTRGGFRRPERVELPSPIGKRRVYDFCSPEYDLLPGAVGLAADGDVSVKVGFEFWAVNRLFAAAALLAPAMGRRVLPKLAAMSPATRKLGTSVGAIMSELRGAGGEKRSVVALAHSDGQRLAALPAAYAVERLLRNGPAAGVWPGYAVIGPMELLRRLFADGVSILYRDSLGGETSGPWQAVFKA